MGAPPAPARTSFAWSGPLRPSAATNSPAAASFWAKSRMKAMCAVISAAAQPAIWYGPPGTFISSMYFMGVASWPPLRGPVRAPETLDVDLLHAHQGPGDTSRRLRVGIAHQLD